MLQVTARVFDNNQLVGYQITDGSQTQLFTRQQAWIFAKNKQLLNVTATGDETNPGLSGTNGFELKRLPEIKWKEPQTVKTSQNFKLNAQDIQAAVIRYQLTGGHMPCDKEEYSNLSKKLLRNDVENGIISPSTVRSLSPHISILEGLTNGDMGFVGWRIKYTGSQPLSITRMTSTPDHSTSEVMLQPQSDMCLSKAELAILASKPEVGCTFANDKLVRSIGYVKPEVDMYKELSSYKAMSSEEYTEGKVPVQKFVDAATISTYFTPVNSGATSSGVKKYIQGDIVAAAIRHAVTTGQPPTGIANHEYVELRKQYLKEDATSGVLTKENCRSLSNSILVEAPLVDANNPRNIISLIIGYKIKNTGSQSIPITRMTATPDHSTSQTSLNPGQSMCLNRAEMALLASKPEIGCTFSNGELVITSREASESLYKFLVSHFVYFGRKLREEETNEIQSVESPSNINTYFIPNGTAKNIQQKGLFNGFKR